MPLAGVAVITPTHGDALNFDTATRKTSHASAIAAARDEDEDQRAGIDRGGGCGKPETDHRSKGHHAMNLTERARLKRLQRTLEAAGTTDHEARVFARLVVSTMLAEFEGPPGLLREFRAEIGTAPVRVTPTNPTSPCRCGGCESL